MFAMSVRHDGRDGGGRASHRNRVGRCSLLTTRRRFSLIGRDFGCHALFLVRNTKWNTCLEYLIGILDRKT
jgi:hypothetical protein